MRISDWSSDVCSSDLHADDDAGRWCRGTVPVGSRGVRHAVCDLAEKRRADHHAGTIRQGSRRPRDRRRRVHAGARRIRTRSEEHTSELQSLMRISYAGYSWKKTTTKTYQQTTQ